MKKNKITHPPFLSTVRNTQQGIAIILVLVFSATLGLSVAALMSFTMLQSKVSHGKSAREQALTIAEAGVEYYKWFLAHNPNDLQNGTGGAGPYVHTYNDPEGGVLGTFSLEITGNGACNTLQSVDIVSTGTAQSDPRFKRVVSARHSRPSVANFSYIINSSVHAGADREIVGPYHSNGGIKMSGTNHSIVSSSLASWTCTSSFGCSPDQVMNGVDGTGSGFALWKYPEPQVDFASITVDLSTIKSKAQADGIYYPAYGNRNGRDGYHLIFGTEGANSVVDVYQVTNTYSNYRYSSSLGWGYDYHRIANEQFIQRHTIDPQCPVIFIEDKAWIEGEVRGKITIAAADLSAFSYDPDIILEDNLTYTTYDGSDGISAVAEQSVLIPPSSPDVLAIEGIFIAQNGKFGRNYYAGDLVTTLNMRGTIVSNGRVGTKWNCGYFCSGYLTRTNTYDRNLANNPPPFTPFASQDYELSQWREVE